MKSIHMAFCTYEIMGIITLAHAHNMSIILYSKIKTSEASRIKISAKGQYIRTSIQYTNYRESQYFQLSGFQFSTFVAKKAVYCLVRGKYIKYFDYSMWLNPFQFEIWFIIFVYLIMLPIPFISASSSIKYGVWGLVSDILNLIGMFFRVAVPINITKRRFYVAASLLGLFYCGINENVILSRVFLVHGLTKYLRLESILTDKYKIIWLSMSSLLPPEEEFKEVFRLKRLKHLLNSSFHEIKSKMPHFESKASYLAEECVDFCDVINLPIELP